MTMIIERKTSSNLCVTSAQPLRFLAILSAVLVMSLANIGVMWGEDNTRTIFLDISQCGWYLNDGYEPRIWVSKNDAKTDTYEIDYTEVVTTNVYRFEIDKGARCIQFMRYKNGDKQNWSGDIWINNASSGSNCCYTYHNYFKLDNNAATVSDANKTSFSSSGEYLYFYADNLTTTTNVAFLLGRWNYTAVTSMSLVSNTSKLYYCTGAYFNDAYSYFSIIGTGSAWSSGSWGTANLSNASDYTAAKYGYKFNSGSTYYATKSSSTKGSSVSVEYKSDGYGAIPKFNATQAAKKRDTGTSYSDVSGDWPASLKLKGTYLSGNGTSGQSTITSTASTDGDNKKVYGAVISGEITHSYESLSSSYYFEGWGTGSTPSVTTATHSYNITAATTTYAFFSKLYTLDFDAKGTKGSSSVAASVANYTDIDSGDDVPTGHTITVTASPATGYEVEGWYSDASCETAYTSGSGGVTISGLGNVTFTLTSLNANSGVYCKFQPQEYTITYKDQGDVAFTGSQTDPPTTHTYNSATTLKIPTKTGYTFGGWFTASDCASGAVGNASAATLGATAFTANITLYAKWTPDVYSISYKEADRTTTIPDMYPTSYTYGVAVESLSTPSKSGYTFDGWYSEYCVVTEHSGAWEDECEWTGVAAGLWGNIKFLAKWHQTVTLNTGSQGSGSNLTPTITYLGTSLSGFSSGHSAFGYSLLGYYSASSEGVKVLKADGTFADDDVEDYITDGKWTKTGATTLYAQWEDLAVDLPTTLNKGNVVAYSGDMTWHNTDYFDFGSTDAANTGRWAKWKVNVHPCQYTVSVVVDYPESPNGYQWGLILMSEDSEDTLAIYNSEQEWGYKSKTYTAKWDLRKDLEGNDLDGTYVLEVKNIYGYAQPKLQSLTLTAAPDAPTGFSAGSITDDDVTFSITDASNAASYDIYYSTSSTAPEAGTAATTTSTSKSKTVSGLTAGATYYAWVRSVCSGGTHKSAWVALNPGGDSHTFQTDYSITIGTITLRRGESEASPGGSISSDTTRARVDDEITLTATPESKYVFVAWQILDDESVDKTDDVLGADSTLTNPTFEMPDYNITVNATFVRQHTITYKESDRETVIGGLAPTSYLYGEGVPSLPTPTKTGYTFAGWYSEYCVFEDEEAEGGSGYGWNEEECGRTSIETDDYGSVTLLATWTANTYTISLNNQSATSAGSTSISVTYDDDENLSDEPAITVPTKTCYTFGGYYTAVDGGGTQIIDADGNVNASVSGYTDASKNWKYANDLTLYAKWTQTNLALNKTPVAGYEPGDNNEKSPKLTDGNTGTAWTTYSGQNPSLEWFYVDLGTVYQLNRIELVWGDVYSTDYILQVRHAAPANSAEAADDTKWYTAAEVTDAAASATKSTTVDVTARYVRFHSFTRSSTFLRLYEFRVYGTGSASTDNTAPVINTAALNSISADGATVKIDVTVTEAGTAANKIYWTVVDKNSAVHVASYSDGVLSVTGMPTGRNQSATIYAMDEAANISSGKSVIIGNYVNPDDNLALNKTSYACANISEGEGKAKANDGNLSTDWTSWTSPDHTNDWWYVDLGDFYDISRIEVVWTDGKHSTDYSMQYRQNAPANNSGAAASEWDTFSEFSGESGNQEIDIDDTQARYICMRSAAYYANSEVRIKELRVFGKGYGTPDVTAPEWTDANCAVTSAASHTITMTLEATDVNPTNVYNFVINVHNGSTGKDYERSTNALNNAVTITDATFIDACETYTITAKCYDHVGNEATKVFSDVATTVASGYNLALGKTATAGTTEDLGHPASLAVDGDTDTQWSGNSGEKEAGVNQWLKVDLGKSYDIDSIKISWGANSGTRPKIYQIQVSYNGTDYISIVHRTSQDGSRENKYLDLDAKGRYVRVWADEYATYGMCISELEVYGKCYTEDNIYDFTGQNASNTAWNTAANWTKGVVPGEGDTVRIFAPVVVPTGSTIQVDEVIIATDGATASGTMTATGKLTVAAGGALIVEGTIKRCADASDLSTLVATTPDDILLESDASHGTGALISATASTNTAATVQLYTKARRDGGYVNQYIGIPFETMNSYNGFYGTYIYAFDVDLDKWSPTGSANFTMEGFAAYNLMRPEASATTLSMGDTLILPGTTDSKDKVLTLTRRGSDVSLSVGTENLFANSWTAPIDVTAMDEDDFVGAEATIYIFNAGTSTDQKSAGAAASDATAAGQWISMPVDAVSYTGWTLTTIPAQQAFLINASGAVGDTHTLTLDYKKHVYDPAVASGATIQPLRAPKRTTNDEPEIVRLHVEGESGNADNLLLFERSDFSYGFDNGWQGRKIEGKSFAPQLYTVSEDGNMSIDAVPDVEGTLIGFKAGNMDEHYTFTFSYDGEDELFLIDTQTGTYTRVENDTTYDFYTSDTDYHTRFALTRHNSPQITTGFGNGENSGNDGMKKAVKFINNDQLFILLNGVLYDATGRRIE